MKLNIRYLYAFIIFIVIEVLIALFIHDRLIRPYLGDVLVVIVIYCFMRIFMSQKRLLPLWIFLFAVLVEILQFFNIVSILGVSDIPVLSTILGSVFDIKDILCYFIGCLILVIWQWNNRVKN